MAGTLHGGRLIRSSARNHAETINALPIGAVTAWMGNDIPADFLGFREVPYPVSRMAYPEFVDAVWCGQAYNADADFFYRTADEAGTIRSETGDWLWMPVGDLYFMRGRDASGAVHPYKYQQDAFNEHSHRIRNSNGSGNTGIWNETRGGKTFANVTSLGGNPASTNDPLEAINPSYDFISYEGEDETRPMNFPVKWIIRAANSRVTESGVDVVALKNQVDGLEAIIEGVKNGQGAPVGSVVSFAGREDAIPAGWMGLAATLQSVLVTQYPGFTNKVWCGSDYNDDADFFYRCDNVDGTGRNVAGQYITLPIGDLYFLRGRDSSGTKHPYQYEEDAFQGHTLTPTSGEKEGAQFQGNVNASPNSGTAIIAGWPIIGGTWVDTKLGSDGVNGDPRIAPETRPMNFPVKWIIKLFDGVSNPDMLDIQVLIDAANNNSVPLGTIMESGGTEADPGYIKCIDTMQFWPINQAPDLFNKVWVGEELNDTAEYFFRCSSDGTRIPDGTYFAIPSDLQIRKSGNPTTIIYPNGGTAEEPANVTVNERLTFSNPYPGHYLYCEAQTFINSVWGTCAVVYSAPNASGLLAGLVEDTVVLQTANGNLGSPPVISCGTWGGTNGAGSSTPCRILVTRLGKMDAPPTFYQIKAWGAVVNQGLADMSRLQAQIAELNTRIVTSTIIYPNGGTEEAPANVTRDQRYVMGNPYPGYYVQCDTQVLVDGKWGSPGTASYAVSTTEYSYGNQANQLLPDDIIVLQTGKNGPVVKNSNWMFSPHGTSGATMNDVPARIIVTRLGKIR